MVIFMYSCCVKKLFDNFKAVQKRIGILGNRYFIVVTFFLIWMLFLDNNSILLQRELSGEIKQLRRDQAFFQAEIEENKRAIEELLGDPEQFERYARENHRMLRNGESLFLVNVGE
jgi:cell division protein DivIC